MTHQIDENIRLSIVVPVFNEAETIINLLDSLEAISQSGAEVIFVDGGSSDQTVERIKQSKFKLITSSPGRALQMNAGAAESHGDILIFLHADTVLPDIDLISMLHTLKHQNADLWGRFDVSLSGTSPLFRLIETMMNFRSRITGIATGDQVLFISRSLFIRTGGFAAIPIMEDVEFSGRLKQYKKPVCLHHRVITSSRRWESRGIIKTMFQMWCLRAAYALGAKPDFLTRYYD